MRRRSLKRTFIATLIGLVLVQSLVLGGIAAYRLVGELEEQFRDRAAALTEHIAQEAFYAAFLQGGAGLTAMVRGLVDDTVLYAQIVVEGRVAAEDNPAGFALPVGTVPAGLALAGRTLDGARYLDVTRALLGRARDASQTSYVRLGISLAYVEYELRQELMILAAAAGGLALLGAGAAFALYRGVLAPLDRLRGSVRRFGARSLDERAPASRWAELDELAGEFNAMAGAIEAMTRQLERDNRAKAEFLTVVGHELRTPLHGMLGYAELLGERIGGPLTDAQARQLHALRASGEHLLALVASILNYTRLELGQEALHPEPLEARRAIEEAAAAVRPLAEAKGLALVTDAADARLRADRTKLKQILLNLLHNAVQYSAQGTVTLSARDEGAWVRFAVRDEGAGIASQDRERVFAPFTQLEAASTRATKGLGLGLALVQRYTELHGGRASLESAPGAGSCFIVRLPKGGEEGSDEGPDR